MYLILKFFRVLTLGYYFICGANINLTSCKTITSQELLDLLISKYGRIPISYNDSKYRLVPEDKLRNYLKSSVRPLSTYEYEQDYNDCDDQSEALKVKIKGWLRGACVGRCNVSYTLNGNEKGHTTVFVVTDTQKILLVDEEDYTVIELPENWKIYEIIF